MADFKKKAPLKKGKKPNIAGKKKPSKGFDDPIIARKKPGEKFEDPFFRDKPKVLPKDDKH